MKLLRFKYKKTPTEVSNRVVIPIHEPSDKLLGIDVSEVSEEDLGLLCNRIHILEQEHIAKRNALMDEFDIKHNYRLFLEAKMSNVTVENVL